MVIGGRGPPNLLRITMRGLIVVVTAICDDDVVVANGVGRPRLVNCVTTAPVNEDSVVSKLLDGANVRIGDGVRWVGRRKPGR